MRKKLGVALGELTHIFPVAQKLLTNAKNVFLTTPNSTHGSHGPEMVIALDSYASQPTDNQLLQQINIYALEQQVS